MNIESFLKRIDSNLQQLNNKIDQMQKTQEQMLLDIKFLKDQSTIIIDDIMFLKNEIISTRPVNPQTPLYPQSSYPHTPPKYPPPLYNK